MDYTADFHFDWKCTYSRLLPLFCGKQRISGAGIQSFSRIPRRALCQHSVDYVSERCEDTSLDPSSHYSGYYKDIRIPYVPYIVADQPDIPAGEAFAISREMMMGQKLEAWILDISFIGWWLAASFTCGLAGIFWRVPYVHAANAELYAVLRENWMRSHSMGPS